MHIKDNVVVSFNPGIPREIPNQLRKDGRESLRRKKET